MSEMNSCDQTVILSIPKVSVSINPVLLTRNGCCALSSRVAVTEALAGWSSLRKVKWQQREPCSASVCGDAVHRAEGG